ncbi:Aste57867_2922 [Aphanomyces stellatus]|uniref:Aste57867_2922 protein n=1 Tax=Aphanomyces stellatus TaxID=120398 RepID=A0A485KA96_9STRA|nr:hypothetical protein As57867_002914 [Aphanomyces stellatus]VFT80105.1 Aste57867_2922 [Aphanomyces stellatus]
MCARRQLALLFLLLPHIAATVWQGWSTQDVACGPQRLCNVSVPTLSTRCAGIYFDPVGWGKPDEVTCIWFPNGTVWRGMNRTRFAAEYQVTTQYIKNEIRGGIDIAAVDAWPNVADILLLNDVGLETIPADSSRDTQNLSLSARQLQLKRNKLTSFNATLSYAMQELLLQGNRLTSVDLSKSNVRELYLADNGINDTTFAAFQLPSAMKILDVSNNSMTKPPNISSLQSLEMLCLDNNVLTTLAPAAFGTTIKKLSLTNTSLTEIRAGGLPLSLRWLCLSNNNISAFYATPAEFDMLSKLINANRTTAESYDLCDSVLSTTSTNASCTGVYTTQLLFGRFPICVVPSPTQSVVSPVPRLPSTPTPSILASSSSSSSSLVWILLTGFLLAILVGLVLRRLVCRGGAAAGDAAEMPWYEENDPAYSPSVTARLHLDVRFEDAFRPFRIPASDIDRRRIVARGGFGIVYEAYWAQSSGSVHVPVALKRLLPAFVDHAASIDDFMHEIRVYATLAHPKIVQFYGIAWTTIANLSIVMELMPHGDVWTLLQAHRASSWRAPLVADTSKLAIALDVAAALVYLHGLRPDPLIHRDVKAKNVLLSASMEAKLSDFGTSRCRMDDLTMTAEIGTAAWIAPEVLKGVRYSEQADIYSFGVFLSEMDTLQMPYVDLVDLVDATVSMTRTRIALMVVSGEITPRFTADSPVRHIAAQCLSHRPEARPTAATLFDLLHSLERPGLPSAAGAVSVLSS